MPRKYGLPYQGSKNRLARQIVSILPPGETLVDLFCGGGAVTDAAIDSGRWNCFIVNDVQPGVAATVADVIRGGCSGADRWISHEEYFARREEEPLMRLLWSFGGNGRSYFCDKQKERLKKIAFDLVTSRDQDVRYKAYRRLILALREDGIPKRFENIEPLARAKNLESMRHGKGVNIEAFEGDYQAVEIPDGAVVYCDIPYRKTESYRFAPKFNYERFYTWCEKQTAPIFVSEYEMPKDRFTCVYERANKCMMDARAQVVRVERLFVPNHQAKAVSNLVLR